MKGKRYIARIDVPMALTECDFEHLTDAIKWCGGNPHARVYDRQSHNADGGLVWPRRPGRRYPKAT